ncbi:MAG TPA: phosphopentomutase [Candidatus Xenobia bacterium]
MERAIILVMDSGGVGEMPDAAEYGDQGSDTLGHVASALGGIQLPTFQQLGLGNLHRMEGVAPAARPVASFGRMLEQSAGKDTTTGHWEMAGLITRTPFPTYLQGFPAEIISAFEKAIGSPILGNKAASGTEIIKELGEEHMRTGKPIVYTSADSVFQIACHEGSYGLDNLYRICEIARHLLVPPHNLSRVIARPFVGDPGHFQRTYNRRDFTVKPAGTTLLDLAKEGGLKVRGVGKIGDIFSMQGVDESHHSDGNLDGFEITLRLIEKSPEPGIIFTNLVDFDMLYGHRRDTPGYGQALRDMDGFLPRLMAAMGPRDAMFISADHGCDPTYPGTDHTREYVPVVAYSKAWKSGHDLGIRSSFADMGASCAELLGLSWKGRLAGESFAGVLA